MTINYINGLIEADILAYKFGNNGPLLTLTTNGQEAVLNSKVKIPCLNLKVGTKKSMTEPDLGECFLPTNEELEALPIEEKKYIVPDPEQLDSILCGTELGKFRKININEKI